MKTVRCFLLVLIIGIFLSGCATTANYERRLNTWLGHNADELVMSWGPPDRSYTLNDGSKVIEYARGHNVTIPFTTTNPTTTQHFGTFGSTPYSGFSTGTQTTTTYHTFNQWCNTRFTVSPQGIIRNWTWEGNHCISD